MQFINPQDNTDLIDLAKQAADIMVKRNRLDIAEELQHAIEQFQTGLFSIAVIGKAKRGKSTLINALLGRGDDMLAPVDKLPASSTITRFRWAEQENAKVFFQNGDSNTIAWNSIREYVTEEYNKENCKGVSTVVVEGPIEGLKNRIELVDTPGAGSIHEYHDAILQAFIPQADAIIFMVTARMPFDVDELELLKQVKQSDIKKVFFVINRVDEIESEEDLTGAIQHNQALLAENGIACETFYKLSAKQAFQGKSNSGIEKLTGAIDSFLQENKNKMLRERFIARICFLVASEAQVLSVALSSATKTNEDLESEIASLQGEKKRTEIQRITAEQEFRLGWTNAVNQFSGNLSRVERSVMADLDKEIENYSVMGVSQLAKQLPTILTNSIESELKPSADAFERQTQELCKKLQVSYPVLELNEVGGVSVRVPQKNGTVIATSVLGGVTAAAGIAAVNAGATAAAGIAAANVAAVGIAAANTAAATTAATAAATAAAAASSAASSGALLSGLGTAVTSGIGALVSTGGNVLVSLGFGVASGISAGGTAMSAASGAATAAAASASTAATAAAGITATYTTTPLWVALSGPVGWTLAGIGVLAVPFAWTVSKMRQKEKLVEATDKKVKEIFELLKTERVPGLNDMGDGIVKSFKQQLDQRIVAIETTLEHALQNRPSSEMVQQMEWQANTLNNCICSIKKLSSVES